MASARNRYGGTGTPTGAGALSAARAITQEGAGVPTHTAPKNTLYRNTVTNFVYINTDGATAWVAVGSGTGTVGQPGRPGEDGRDGEDGWPIPGPPGTNGTNGADGRMGPSGWDAEPAEDLGLWLPPSVPVSPRFKAQSGALVAAGAAYDTFPRYATMAALTPPVSGTLLMLGIDLPIDQIATSISVLSGATGSTLPTHQFFGLYDSALNLLRSSVDDGATAWAANTIKTLALTSVFRLTYSGLHYIGVLVTAATVPTYRGLQPQTPAMVAPILAATSSTGLTALPNPAAALVATNIYPYAYVS